MKKVRILIISLVVICGIAFIFIIKWRYQQARIRFLCQWVTKKQAVNEIKYSEKFKLHWLKNFAVTMIEGRGREDITSEKGAEGSKQVLRSNLRNCREYFRTTISNRAYRATEFNIASGSLMLRIFLDYCDQNYYKAVEVYNMGLGNIRIGKKNSNYVVDWAGWYTILSYEWEEFDKIF